MTANSYVYNNFELYNPLISIDWLLWALVIGLGIGAVASFFHRRAMYALVSAIAKSGASTPEAAKTLAELGVGRNPLVRLALRSGKRMRRTVLCANEGDFAPAAPQEEKKGFGRAVRRFFSIEPSETPATDFAVARFYIPEENRIAAEVRYDRKGTDVPSLILSLALIIALGFAVQYLLPQLMTMFDNLLTMIEA